MKKIFYALLGVIVLGIVLVFSLNNNTPDLKKSSVKEITENAVALDNNDAQVTLTGTIASQISKKRFWFEDGTGQIIIEVKQNLLPLVPASNDIEIEIQGKVDCQTDDGNGVKIDVKEIIFNNTDSDEEDFLNQ